MAEFPWDRPLSTCSVGFGPGSGARQDGRSCTHQLSHSTRRRSHTFSSGGKVAVISRQEGRGAGGGARGLSLSRPSLRGGLHGESQGTTPWLCDLGLVSGPAGVPVCT